MNWKHKPEQARLERESREGQARLERQLREREIQDRLAVNRELKEKEIVVSEGKEKKIEAEINKNFDLQEMCEWFPLFLKKK